MVSSGGEVVLGDHGKSVRPESLLRGSGGEPVRFSKPIDDLDFLGLKCGEAFRVAQPVGIVPAGDHLTDVAKLLSLPSWQPGRS